MRFVKILLKQQGHFIWVPVSSRSRDFCTFLDGIGTGLEKSGTEKVSESVSKKMSTEKVSESVTTKFGSEKVSESVSFRFWVSSHTDDDYL